MLKIKKNIIVKISILLAISFFLFLIWLLEINFKGWAGKAWGDYTYIYISPFLTILLFPVFVFFVIPKTIVLKYKILISILSLAEAYIILSCSFYIFYKISFIFFMFETEIILLCMPIFAHTLLFILRRSFKIRSNMYTLSLGIFLSATSIFSGMLINGILFNSSRPGLKVFGYAIQNDITHSIKTGSHLVFLISGLGLPFIFTKQYKIIDIKQPPVS